MLRRAKHEFLVVNDSDIRVGSDYLRRIMPPFADQEVGMVTCLYRGIAGRTLGSKLESAGISTDFIPSVLAARQVESGVRFALGSTLAIRRATLDAIGGLEPLLDHLADDYELGSRTAQLGQRVVLSPVVVETNLSEYSFAAYYEHQLRWGRTTRDSRRWGYAGVGVTFALPWALFAFAASGAAAWTWPLLAVAALLRYAVAWSVGIGVLHDRSLPGRLWLLPLRDMLALVVWAHSLFGDTIVWRGRRFLLRDKKIYPA
jgi:ceramide glucosyltransferase